MNLIDVNEMIGEVRKAFSDYVEQYDIDIENTVVVVNNSGGKDSGATNLLAHEIFGDNYRSVAADTGNEHPLTIEHIKTLHEQGHSVPVEIVRAIYTDEMFAKRKERVIKDWGKKQCVMAGEYRGIIMPSLSDPNTKFAENWRKHARLSGWSSDYWCPLDAFKDAFHPTNNPFLNMALIHGGFPLGRQRFCTQELKIDAVFNQVVHPLLDQGKTVIQWSGVRGDESEKRAGYERFSLDKRDAIGDLYNFLPIHKWNAAQVFALYKYFGVKPNPLYTQGMGRVGCMPCILVSKEELAEVAARFPDEIERIRSWESQVAKVSRWIHWMMVGHVNRRQFKDMTNDWIAVTSIDENTQEEIETKIPRNKNFKFGDKIWFPRYYKIDNESYRGTSFVGPRGGIIGGNIDDAIDWSRTGRGGRVYDLVTASLNADVCSSKYGLCE